VIPICNLQDLPKTSGVYRVVDADGITIYVGQAKNIYNRWNNGHHKLSKIINLCGTNAFIEWVELPEDLLNRDESMLIDHFKPKLNLRKVPIV
jgi:excinuclease UvrABC nuclease subunit